MEEQRDAQSRDGNEARPEADSVGRTLAQVGDAWTFLILREAFFGVRRFDGFLRNLDASPAVLSDRLRKLTGFGLLEKRPYSERPTRHEYRLTAKGLDLYPAIVLLMRWGDRWLDEGQGPPLHLIHRVCGNRSQPVLVCDACDRPVQARDMTWEAVRR